MCAGVSVCDVCGVCDVCRCECVVCAGVSV